ncbi:MAG: hypothetical protein D3904_01145 [Candidatus Electrothrix sp. EH2]|nr:hypothetical protein [Candidatus Electrothrix sp. EH2]
MLILKHLLILPCWVLKRYLSRPYPFQLWVAPRNRLQQFFFPGESKGKSSPPGFGDDYALFLYPDNIGIDWIVFFIGIVVIPQIFAVIFSPICVKWAVLQDTFLSIGCSFLFFLFSYKVIYVLFRSPILDDLWNISPENASNVWPKTPAQNEDFQSVPSRITFYSKEECSEYNKKFSFPDHTGKYILSSCIEKIFFCNNKIKLKKIDYFHRPVFFTPGRSLQETLLCTGIASFFAKKENSLRNILRFMFYSLSHIWVSYLYLSLLLLWIFIIGKPASSQSETIYLVVQITLEHPQKADLSYRQYCRTCLGICSKNAKNRAII